MKILIVPDSFKGSLTSREVCECIYDSLKEADSTLETTALPFSDGGEGFSDCMLEICKGNKLYTDCHNIYNRPIKGSIVTFGDTAVIECATASGIQPKNRVMQASSYGTGELIRFAVSQGFRRIILGLGGSGCCDGGAGALSALGASFYDENYKKISFPKGIDLNCIFGAGFGNIVKDISFTFACDVENTLFGKNGAAYIFAPQKGARQSDVEELDEGLKRLNAFLPRDVSTLKGGGAAGGICAGLYSVYEGEIKSGFDVLSDYAGLRDKIAECDIVITGEGKTDSQTLMGKLPFRIASLAKEYKKKCIVISGCIDGVSLGDKMISLTDSEHDSDYAIAHAKELLKLKSKYILK